MEYNLNLLGWVFFMISLVQVSKFFANRAILSEISLEIPQGQILGIAGPSGGGKSTLLRCIQGLDTIDGGSISLKGSCGFMFQDFQLFPHMTVMKNLTYACTLGKTKNNHGEYEERAKNLLENLGIGYHKDSYPWELSGGQKQRVALGRSLMKNPNILLCDEPTSGLDVATIDDVCDLLRSVQKNNMTLVIASHDLDFLTHMAHRVVVLKNGQIQVDMDPRREKDPVGFLKTCYGD